ncbi:hypothetical protein BDE02_03G035100 [Populus trichocarpa]|nr:hypothetical protein BDE02_03G035100 [Populus trichocarpa]
MVGKKSGEGEEKGEGNPRGDCPSLTSCYTIIESSQILHFRSSSQVLGKRKKLTLNSSRLDGGRQQESKATSPEPGT